jgi:hypothetical protein
VRAFLLAFALLVAAPPVGAADLLTDCAAWWARAGNKRTATLLTRADGLPAFLERGPISKVELYKSEGKSEAYIVTFEDGTRALFKPAQERNAIGAETGAYALDQLLGFDMVPVTTSRSLKTGVLKRTREGSLQHFIEGAQESTSAASYALADSDSFRRMAFFDYVSANPDRNYNYLVKDGHYVLIDNGMSFAPGARPPSLLGLEHLRLPPTELERLSKLTQADFRRTLGSHLGEQGAVESFRRFEELMRRLGHPLPGP